MPMPNPRQHLTKSEENNRIMLPRRMATAAENNNNSNVARLNAAFVADNRIGEPVLKLKMVKNKNENENETDVDGDGELERTNNISVSGNIEAETNKLELVDNDEFDKYKSGDDSSASARNRIVRKDRLTMENNEEAEELKNLNESLSLSLPSPSPSSTPTPMPANNVDKIDEAVQVEVDAEHLTETVLELSTAANEDVEDSHNKFDKIPTTTTTIIEPIAEESEAEENIYYYNNEQVKEVESHSNLAINRDREDMTDSDEEELDVVVDAERFLTLDAEWADLANSKHVVNNFGNEQEFENESQEFHVPVDLSNDIKVNDYAAAQNVPYNPDAEFIVVTSNGNNLADSSSSSSGSNDSMPMFEKLSMK